ncbi:MAG: DUF2975 domain-containing protein [Clostridiales bacterium]|jgi:hypothetical protein|nr:DUF2975 domain-containing protein [Clostridiales bacterium]
MKKSIPVLITKILLDFMFYSGILICLGVPYLFDLAGKYFDIFDKYYLPFTIIYMISGLFALAILWELRAMFRTVIKEDPFVTSNVTSLKRMGYYAFVIVAAMIAKLFFVVTPTTLILVLVFLIAGLFSHVLSQVFDQAVAYKYENDLTI